MQDSENSEYLNIIIEMTQAKKKRLEAIRRQENSTISGKIVLLIQQYGIPGCLISILISILIKLCFGYHHWIAIIGLISLVLLYLCCLSYPLFELWNNRVSVKSFLYSPFYHFFQTEFNLSSSMSTLYFPKLMRLSELSLELALVELKQQYFDLEHRICLLIGPIKNIGLVPGVLALLMMISKMEKNHSWAEGIAYANIILFMLSTIAHINSSRWAHAIALTELALKKKQELKKNFERISSISSGCK